VGEEAAIRVLPADEALRRIDELIELIGDAVAGGASVNFLAGATAEDFRRFWMSTISELETGRQVLFVADEAGGPAVARIVGTTLLALSQKQNSPHRGDIGKMLVHSSCRRRGLGARLLAAAEDGAHQRGRTLLLLDTESGSAGEALYRASGWTVYGVVPRHALKTDGTPKETTFFYKIIGG
jgi:GNAT superfamily N-acetyltransferase